MSSSRRCESASGGAHPPARSPLPAAALSPVRQSARRAASRPDVSHGTVSIARALWPSSSGSGNSKNKKALPAPPQLCSASPPSSSAATLADHLTKDALESAPPQSLSRQRSCTELPRFADADAEARKIGKPAAPGKSGHAFGRSMRFLPSTKPAGVTLTPGRVAPSDLRRLAVALDADADVRSSGSECSDASRGSTTPRKMPKQPHSPLLARTSSVRLLGSNNTHWALSPGRRSGSPLKTTLPTVPETAAKGSKKSLISLGWGHIFNRRKAAVDMTSMVAAAAAATVLSWPASRTSAGGGEVGHKMRMAHCRLLQWRFANAKADTASKTKLEIAEVELMGTWARISELRGKVARKRVQLQKDKLNMKLDAVLSSQMSGLDGWGQLEGKQASALASTVGCARAAVYQLPVTNGAKVSIPSVASILHQVVELTMTAKTKVRPFSPMAQDSALLVSELMQVASDEQSLLQECLELLRRVSALQVKEQSLRCQMVQSSSLNLVRAWNVRPRPTDRSWQFPRKTNS